MATTTRKQRSTDTRTTPHSLASKASVKFGFVVRPRRSRADPTSTKTHRSHATTPNEATTRADEPSWHQLLGTLLSSQRTDAHPSLTLTGSATGGCHSNLPEFLARFVAVPGDSLASNPTRAFGPSFRAVLSRSDMRNPTRLSGPLCRRAFPPANLPAWSSTSGGTPRRRPILLGCAARGTSHRVRSAVSVPPSRATRRTLRVHLPVVKPASQDGSRPLRAASSAPPSPPGTRCRSRRRRTTCRRSRWCTCRGRAPASGRSRAPGCRPRRPSGAPPPRTGW